MKAARSVALFVVAALALAACGSEAVESQGAQEVFSGEFETISGETFDFGSLEGQDVVLWFWAPW